MLQKLLAQQTPGYPPCLPKGTPPQGGGGAPSPPGPTALAAGDDKIANLVQLLGQCRVDGHTLRPPVPVSGQAPPCQPPPPPVPRPWNRPTSHQWTGSASRDLRNVPTLRQTLSRSPQGRNGSPRVVSASVPKRRQQARACGRE